MSLKRIRKLEDKLKVLEEVEEAKIVEVCRKYQITPLEVLYALSSR